MCVTICGQRLAAAVKTSEQKVFAQHCSIVEQMLFLLLAVLTTN
jgi:hypothetical protein